MQNLPGKTAFVTGGASGIGLGIAKALLGAGMNVVIADIREDHLTAATRELDRDEHVLALQLDVTDRRAYARAAEAAEARFGKIHLLCNNAGIAVIGPTELATYDDWDWVMGVNLGGTINGIVTILPRIKRHGEGGHIVNTASLAGLMSGPGLEPYNATKHAVVTMSESWRVQLAPQGIGVSVLCPGVVRTNIMEGRRNRQARYVAEGTSDAAMEILGGDQGRNFIQQGLDPDIVGELVVEFVRANEPYIITDPRWLPFVERRFAAIRAGFEAATKSQALKAAKHLPPMPPLPSGR